MKLDFSAMEQTTIPHFKGGEGQFLAKMYNDAKVKILEGTLAPGCTVGLHTHDTNSEIILILSGHGTAICDGVDEPVGPGDCHYCPQGHNHTLINASATEDLVFFAVVPEHQ
jgi:mannose-6-phosphate isomerase-like protein (cupin superfamily)